MISGTISLEEHLAAIRLHRRTSTRWTGVFVGVVFVVGLAMWVAGETKLGYIVLGGSAGGMIGALFVMQVYWPWHVRRVHRQHKVLSFPITYLWDESHLETRNARGQSRAPWTDLLKVRENERLFLLYVTDHLFEVVPKHWFQSKAQIDEFRRAASRVGTTH